jgi:hypothetical protein
MSLPVATLVTSMLRRGGGQMGDGESLSNKPLISKDT